MSRLRRRPLIQLIYSDRSQEILSSPFFNFFAALFLGLMPKDEALHLMRDPVDGAFTTEGEISSTTWWAATR